MSYFAEQVLDFLYYLPKSRVGGRIINSRVKRSIWIAHPVGITVVYTYSMVQSPSWEANWFADSQEIPHIFMEPEGSLPDTQASATCPCPGPAQSSLHNHIPPPGDPSQYYPPNYA